MAKPQRPRWKRILLALVLIVGLPAATAWFLCACMPGLSFRGALPPLTEAQSATAARLRATVEGLCALGEHNLDHPRALAAAIARVEFELAATGIAVRREAYAVGTRGHEALNLWIDVPGRSGSIVVVGAHYDSARGAVGANDNGSGVAALTELARRAASWQPEHTLRFVAFANEEPPYYHQETMGSLVHARAAMARGEELVAMLSLETIGYYSDEPDSQHYPLGILGWVYPERGDFLTFVGDLGSRALVRQCVGTFREHASFPSEGAALPASIPGVDWSDHWSFRQVGCPALMVTDTAPFRYPHYHEPTDTPDKLDYERMARAVDGLEAVLAELAVARVR